MQEALAVARPIRFDNGAWQVSRAPDRWQDLLAPGGGLVTLQKGWRLAACVEIPGPVFLLALRDPAEREATALADRQLRLVCSLRHAKEKLAPEAYERISGVAGLVFKSIRRRFVEGTARDSAKALVNLGRDGLGLLNRAADVPTRTFSVLELARTRSDLQFALKTASETILLAGERVRRLLLQPPPSAAAAARAGAVEISALTHDGSADAVLLVGHTGSSPTYLCRESPAGLHYLLIHSPQHPPCLYFPLDDVLLCEWRLTEAAAAGVIRRLDMMLLPLALTLAGPVPERSEGLALLTFGFINFGHAIWDEMHVLDSVLAQIGPGGEPPALYLAEAQSAV